jgi:hypothetical protein
MWQAVLQRWRQRREAAVLARRAIPDLLWRHAAGTGTA